MNANRPAGRTATKDANAEFRSEPATDLKWFVVALLGFMIIDYFCLAL
jgi:hypothetical protein